MGRHRLRRRIGAALAAVGVLLAAGFTAAGPAVAQEDDGLRIEADTSYWVLPDEGAVAVVISMSIRNEVADVRQGNQILQTYFRSVLELLPLAVSDVAAARSNGTTLDVSPADIPAEAVAELAEVGLQAWEIDLGPNLFYRQTRDLQITYRLLDGEARSLDAWARVNPATAAFPVFARGDAGLASVSVLFPPGFDVEYLGDALTPNDRNAPTVWSVDAIENPAEWSAFIVGFSDEGLVREPLEVPGFDQDVTIAAWPGDVGWTEFVRDGVSRGVPELEDATGIAFPIDGELEVLQTFAPSLAGYGGWYYEPDGSDEREAVIEVGEALDLDLLLHEVAHSWFNNDLTQMRWFNEGMAEYFAQVVAEELEPGSGEPFETVEVDDAAALRLVTWRRPSFDPDEATEAFGYAASYQVVRSLAEEIGEDALAEVLDVLFEGRNPYREELTVREGGSMNWQQVLDAVEVTGGSEQAEDLFTEWVVTDGALGRLDERAEAQEAVAGLEREPLWAVPDVIPERLGAWRFGDANALVDDSHEVFDRAVALEAQASTRSITVPSDAQEAYEAEGDLEAAFDEARDLLEEQQTSLDLVLGAYDRSEVTPSFVGSVGLWGEDVDAIVAEAHAAFEAGDHELAADRSAAVTDIRGGAADVGRSRLLLAGGALVGAAALVALGLWVRRRRHSDPTDVGDPAPDPASILDP